MTYGQEHYAGELDRKQIMYISETLSKELGDIRQYQVTPSQCIGYTLLNRLQLGEEKPIVSFGGFMSQLKSPDRAYEGILLSELNRPVLMLEMPGHGVSSKHSGRQSVDLCFRRTIDSQVQPMVDTVSEIIHKDEFDIFGVSHGGAQAVKTADLLRGQISHVFGVDIPGVKKQKTIPAQAKYVVLESYLNRKKILEQNKELENFKIFEEFKKDYPDAISYSDYIKSESFAMKNPGLLVMNLMSSINASPYTLKNWKSVMENTKTNITVMTGEKSGVSDYLAINYLIANLSRKQQERSKQYVFSNEDHNITMIHRLPRAIRLFKETVAE